MIPVFFGKIENGEMKLLRQIEFGVLMERLEGSEIALTLSKRPLKRSKQANAYYYATLVEMLAGHYGNRKEVMHEVLKGMFLKQKTHLITKKEAKEVEYVRSSATLTKEEFNLFIDRVKQFAAEEGFVVPDREELLSEKLEEEIKNQ